jgi:hypothetical protein
MKKILFAAVVFLLPVAAQQPAAPNAPRTAQALAPIDVTGTYVSIIVDEWRFRVSPAKGDVLYMPLNAEARKVAGAWDPDKDETAGQACKAYGAVGVMQRPGRIRISWADGNTLKLEADAGTQSRAFNFAAVPPGAPSLQGQSVAGWQGVGGVMLDLGGLGFVPGLVANAAGGAGGRRGPAPKGGALKVVTTNMLPGYLRKNGVPYSDKAVLTEYFNVLTGQQNDQYLVVTAFVEDPTYLAQPFIRTYQFKKQADNAGWAPTPCLTR